MFFIDFEGHVDDAGIAGLLAELARSAAEVKQLGSYPLLPPRRGRVTREEGWEDRCSAAPKATAGRFPTELSDICRFPALASAAECRFCWKPDAAANHADQAPTHAIRAVPRSGGPRVCYVRGCRWRVRGCRRGLRGVEP